MGFLDVFRKKNNSAQPTTNPTNEPSSPKVSLVKSKEALETAINLSKDQTGVDITNVKARVAVVMDYSGSMSDLYENGVVQDVLTRFLPFALQFDDNGELDVYLFANDCWRVEEPMTEANYEKYVLNYIIGKYNYGGTEYAPAIRMTDTDYNDIESKSIPSLVFFITDGDNFDPKETNSAIVESAKHGIFYMFLGIGNCSFQYLRTLDDLCGRVCDNTGFMPVTNIRNAKNLDLFMSSLKDYIPWLKTKGYLK